MDGTTAAAVVSGAVALIIAVFGLIATRKKSGLPDPAGPAPDVVVERLAREGVHGMTPEEVGYAVAAMAQTIGSLTLRVGKMERHELIYRRRLAVVEYIAVHSDAPPPRTLPPWPEEPQDQQ